jgi:EAL domain-containing protein (putative c-di-GMP-specific phosphodiesterase class I)
MSREGTFRQVHRAKFRRTPRERAGSTLVRLAPGAIERGSVPLDYQPKVGLSDQRLAGFDARLRADHPGAGMVRAGEIVLGEACRQMAFWQTTLPMEPRLEINVGVSPEYLGNPALVLDLQLILAETGLLPESLGLQVRESSVIACGEGVDDTLHRLKELGIRLEIGGFGTGSASPAYLRTLPFDAIRLGRSFVKQLGTNHDSAEIIETILALAGSLGMTVDAEGVETEEQADQLLALGCRRGQGLYFSGTLDAAGAQELIRTYRQDRGNVRPFPPGQARAQSYSREDSNL